MHSTAAKVAGLNWQLDFLRDGRFYLALAAAPVALMILTWLAPDWSSGIRPDLRTVWLFVVWQPAIEEVLFRGVIQGNLLRRRWARGRWAGLTLANYAATLLFVLAHLFHHSAWWACAVVLPSLLFGYMRDRYRHILPCILLHASYNACYLAAGLLVNRYGNG